MTDNTHISPNTLAVDFPDIIASLLTVGIVMVDRRFTIVLWNRFMELNSQIRGEEVLGKNLFDAFPELNRNWLEKKNQKLHHPENAILQFLAPAPLSISFQTFCPSRWRPRIHASGRFHFSDLRSQRNGARRLHGHPRCHRTGSTNLLA